MVDTHSPKYILQHDPSKLTRYECSEILKFDTVYYYGQKANKCYDTKLPNNGLDNMEGDYNPVVNDHIAYRYELVKLLGAGSFGRVYKAYDHKHKVFVALKMLKSKKKFRRQGLVEIQLMEKLREGDPHNRNHCITILNRGEFRGHLFIITSMLSCDLYALLAEGDLVGLDC